MLINLARDVPEAMWKLLWALGMLVGTLYCGNALLRMSRASRLPGQSPVTMGEILPVMIIGGLMFNLNNFINATWNSMGTGTVSYDAISYATSADFGKFADAINAVLTLASVAGGCYFFKGVLLLKRATADGQSSHGAEDLVWRAITHMLGGSLLVQIPDTIERFRQSLHLFW
ncbi:MAG: conjugal transfer protein TraQ [Pseudomonadota bacterium]